MKLTETQGTILERLIEAMETDIALPVRIGPQMFGSSMPDYVHSEHEYFVLEREDETERKQHLTRQRKNERRREIERRAKCTKERISRMERTFDAVIKSVADEEIRDCLLDYAMVKARGWDWGRFVTSRNRRNPQKRAWVRQNTYRWILKALQFIEARPANLELLLPDLGALPVRQIGPESTGKSIRSDLRSWMAPDGNPSYRRTA